MIQFLASGLAHNWHWLNAEKNAAHARFTHDAGSIPTPVDVNRLNGLLKTGNGAMQGWLPYCKELQMEKSTDRIEHFLMILNVTNVTPIFRVVHSELLGLENAIWRELKERTFVFVPTDRTQFFEQEKLFGDSVHSKFPSTRLHIKDSGNCLAADLNTSAVYHLMCVVNIGLLALAKHLESKIEAIEYQEWKIVIENLEAKVRAVQNTPRGKMKSDELAFYSGLLAEFNGFNEVYRKEMAHARARYNELEALAVFQRVRDFMQRLTNKVSE
jgi:hypothetical protein